MEIVNSFCKYPEWKFTNSVPSNVYEQKYTSENQFSVQTILYPWTLENNLSAHCFVDIQKITCVGHIVESHIYFKD